MQRGPLLKKKDKKNGDVAVSLYFMKYLAFFWPAADRIDTYFPGLQAEVAHKGFSELIPLTIQLRLLCQ
jgi:hypothetical protein